VKPLPDYRLKVGEAPPNRQAKENVKREIKPFVTEDTISRDGVKVEPIHVG
jgi:hypothetical protein